jgi:hypothetical protein
VDYRSWLLPEIQLVALHCFGSNLLQTASIGGYFSGIDSLADIRGSPTVHVNRFGIEGPIGSQFG